MQLPGLSSAPVPTVQRTAMDLIAGLYWYAQNTGTFPTVLEICKQGWSTSVLHELACFGAVLVLPNPNPSDHPGPDRRVVVPTRNGMRLQGRGLRTRGTR